VVCGWCSLPSLDFLDYASAAEGVTRIPVYRPRPCLSSRNQLQTVLMRGQNPRSKPRSSVVDKNSGLSFEHDTKKNRQGMLDKPVSKANISSKCLTANSDGAAAVSVTCVVIVGSSWASHRQVNLSRTSAQKSRRGVRLQLINMSLACNGCRPMRQVRTRGTAA
jgi:hypothetical protein